MDDIFEDLGLELARKQVYENYTNSALYITMRDGVKIAADIYIPEGLPPNEKIPTILIQTCYWRVKIFKKLFKWLQNAMMVFDFIKEFISYGFAIVYTDVRGTGASFGTRNYPWTEEEIADNKDIVEWIISQPWSDGNIMTWGHSYLGTTAELAGVVNHPAIKGLVPMHNEFDPYLDLAFPGGVYDEYFVDNWAHYTLCLDHNNLKDLGLLPRLAIKGVKPVDSDENKEFLREAIKEHLGNVNVAEMAKKSTFRDDQLNDIGDKFYNFSVYRYIEEISNFNVPMFSWGSWRDAATSNAVIGRFLNFQNPQISMIGAWSHAAYFDSNPYLPFSKREPNPSYKKQVEIWVRFFENCLKGTKDLDKLIIYYTMGVDEWKTTNTWPPSGQIREKWYLGENNSLTKSIPPEGSDSDNYQVNFKASTGKHNRWYTEMGAGQVFYKDRAKQDKLLIVYDSDPLKKDMEITGYPIITLYLTSTHEDGVIFAYLEDIDEKGNVVHVTEGELRLIHRKISEDKPIYNSIGPYHSFLRKDNLPMVPGKIEEVKISLIPTSIVIQKGHRIRIAIAGADKDTFSRCPADGNPVITISRNKNHASYIELPIIQ